MDGKFVFACFLVLVFVNLACQTYLFVFELFDGVKKCQILPVNSNGERVVRIILEHIEETNRTIFPLPFTGIDNQSGDCNYLPDVIFHRIPICYDDRIFKSAGLCRRGSVRGLCEKEMSRQRQYRNDPQTEGCVHEILFER